MIYVKNIFFSVKMDSDYDSELEIVQIPQKKIPVFNWYKSIETSSSESEDVQFTIEYKINPRDSAYYNSKYDKAVSLGFNTYEHSHYTLSAKYKEYLKQNPNSNLNQIIEDMLAYLKKRDNDPFEAYSRFGKYR